MSLLFGVVLPSILFSFPGNRNRKVQLNSELIDQTTAPNFLHEPLSISVLMDDGSVTDMKLDTYLTAVLLQEMPAEFDREALKAQAVVARTYALRRVGKYAKHDNATVCTDSACCQGYCSVEAYLRDGGNTESVQRISDAVSSTNDEVLIYNNELIEATYFSCSGGMTEDAAAVWGADIPYLIAKESPGEEKAVHYTDTVTFTTSEFAKLLDLSVPEKVTQWVGSTTYTPGGGVERIQICGKDYKGIYLRQKLGLRSTMFVITVIGDTVTITTKGFGHRVGMSQYGAEAMAVQGNTYRQILSHYYSGSELISYAEIDNDV